MAIVVPVVLTQPASNVIRVISLFPVLPIFPNTLRASQLLDLDISTYPRDNSQISKGFPHSINLDVPNYNLSTNQSESTLLDPYPGIVFPLPANAYAVVPGSETTIPGTTHTSVLLIDCTVCPVEPGISRLRVDYVTNNYVAQTDYLDMPFWQGWDTHPNEIQQIVDYAEESIQYVQDEVVVLQDSVFNALERAQLKGLSVSGTLGTTQAINTYNPITRQKNINTTSPHGMPSIHEPFVFSEKRLSLPSKTITMPYTITSVVPDSGVFAGDTIYVTIDEAPNSTDCIFLGSVKLKTTINGSVLSATLPSTLTYTFSTNLRIASSTGTSLTADYDLSVLALPSIQSILGKSYGNVVKGAQFILTGSNFGLSKGATTITFNPSLSAAITLWSPTKIAGIVPTGATTGFVALTTNNGKTAKVLTNVAGANQTDVFTVTPNIVAVVPGETLQFTSNLNGESVQSNWAITGQNGNIGTGNVGYGFIDAQTGLYTAPSSVFKTFNLNVVCNHVTSYGNLYASTSVVVLSSANTLTITPALTILQSNNTQMFTLSNGGSPVSNVSWYVNGLLGGNSIYGAITQSGLYQAPPIIPQNSSVFVTGIATSGAGTAPVQIVAAQNAQNQAQAHSMRLDSKTVTPGTGAASCIPNVSAQYSATVGQLLTLTTYAMSTNEGGAYYVTAYNQPSCGNQDGILTVSDGTQLNPDGNPGDYGIIYFTPQSSGFYSIVIYVSSVIGGITTANQYYVQVNVAQAHPFQLSTATSTCPGNVMTVKGQNFPTDSQIRIAETNQSLQVVQGISTTDGVNYSINVLLPSSLSNTEGTAYHLYLYSPTVGISQNKNELEILIPSGCGLPAVTATLEITPGQETYVANQEIQYIATLQASNGINTDVTDSTIWYVYSSTSFTKTPIQGGNSEVGTINSNGLYTAPSTGTDSYTIVGQNSYSGTPQTGNAYLTPIPTQPTSPTYGNAPTSEESDCVVLDITPVSSFIAVPGPGVQFTCTCHNVTHNTSGIVKPDAWFVNGVKGGDAAHGTIDADGYYTPPKYYPPNDYARTEIGARYTLHLNEGTSVLNNYAIIKYYQSVHTSGDCNVSIVSQINIEFGDGRNGYIPTTTAPVRVPANSYLLTQYQEILDSNFLPIPEYTSQALYLSVVSAQAPNLATVIYNQGQIYPIEMNGQPTGQYTRPYTVVLGICDPTSGLFQSMWDEITVVQPIQNSIPLPPTNCDMSLSHSLPNTLTEHIESKLSSITPIKVLPSKFIWAAKGSYDKNKLTFEDVPKLLYFDENDNFFKAEKIGDKKSFNLKSEQILACIDKDGSKELVVLGLNDTIPDDSRIYVLGVVLDKFQSLSPFLTVKSGFTMYEGKNQVLKLNNLLIQWGILPTDKNKIKFDVPFKSYNLNLSPGATIQKSSPKDFDYTIIDKGVTNTWFAMGS